MEQTPVENAGSAPSVVSEKKHKHLNKIICLGLALLLAILVALGALYLVTNIPTDVSLDNAPKTQTEEPVSDSMGTTVPAPTVYSDTDIWFNNQTYPSELTSLSTFNVLAVTCGDIYSDAATSGTYLDQNDGSALTDNDTLTTLSDLNAGRTVFQIRKCVPETVVVDGQVRNGQFYLYNYCNTNCGGGIGSINGVAFYNTVAADAIEFPNTTGAYAECLDVLAYSRDSKIYLNCTAGDGGSSSKEIYQVDLPAHTATSIAKETTD